MSKVYPNLYLLMVAPPGVGKSQAIAVGQAVWERSKKMRLAPDDVTKASLVDHLARAMQTKIYSPTEMMSYHSLQVAADEFGVLCSAHDLSFMSTMNVLYDNRAFYRESRRGRETDLVIENPQVNMIAGTQPDFLANLLPPEAWGMGFMSRILMIYQGSSVKPKLFSKSIRKGPDMREVQTDFNSVCELHGEMDWSPEAEDMLVGWYESGMEPVPTHSKLKHYVPRRILTIIKLCIVSSASRGASMVIEIEDVFRARDWLVEIESLMPDVFKDMNGQSDSLVIQDLHHFVWAEHVREKKAVHRSRIEVFLMARTPTYNIENIIKSAVAAKILIDQPGLFYLPGNSNNLRVE